MNTLNIIDFKTPVLLFLKVISIMLVVNLIYEIALFFFEPEIVQYLFVWNPILCGFIHSSPSHFFYNILLLFILFLPKINYALGLKKVIGYIILISLICFPFIALRISLPFVGVSGFYFFLLTNYILSIEKYKLGIRILFGIFMFSEIGLMGNNDTVSHLCHVVGFLIASTIYFKKNINFEIVSNKYLIKK